MSGTSRPRSVRASLWPHTPPSETLGNNTGVMYEPYTLNSNTLLSEYLVNAILGVFVVFLENQNKPFRPSNYLKKTRSANTHDYDSLIKKLSWPNTFMILVRKTDMTSGPEKYTNMLGLNLKLKYSCSRNVAA